MHEHQLSCMSEAYRSESLRVIMDGCKMLYGIQTDPEDCAFGDEVAPNMHVPGSQPVCAGSSRIQP